MMESYSVDQAQALYQSNQFQQAEKMCRRILIEDSKNVFAVHLLGLIAFKLVLSTTKHNVEVDDSTSENLYLVPCGFCHRIYHSNTSSYLVNSSVLT